MKIQVLNYSFNKATKAITFTDYVTVRLDQILLITDVTRNVVLYQFNDPLLGGTVTGNVLTLTKDTNTGSFANTDKLQIFIDDNTATQAINDNGGSLTVDGAVSVSGVSTAANQSTLLGYFKDEDSAHTSGDKGVMALAVRNDSGTVVAGTTGDYIPLTTDSTGALRVTGGGGGSGGLTDTELRATAVPVSVSGVATAANQSTTNTTLASIDAGIPAGLGSATSSSSMPVVIASDQDFIKTEDAAHSSGDKGVFVFGTRQDVPAATAGTSGDYQGFATDTEGKLWVRPTPKLVTLDADIPGIVAAAYADGDVIGTVMTISGAAGASGRFTHLREVRFTDFDDVMGAFDLFVFDATITVTDNGAFAPSDANVNTAPLLLGVLRFSGNTDVGGARFYELNNVGKIYKTNASADLFGVVVTRAAITLASNTAGAHRFTFIFEQV